MLEVFVVFVLVYITAFLAVTIYKIFSRDERVGKIYYMMKKGFEYISWVGVLLMILYIYYDYTAKFQYLKSEIERLYEILIEK